MSKKVSLMVFVAIVLVMCISVIAEITVVQNRVSYEYAVDMAGPTQWTLEEALTKRGKDGWALKGFQVDGNEFWLIWERTKE